MRTKWLRPTAPSADPSEEPPLKSKLFWFLAISLASVTVVASSAYVLRGFLFI